MKRYLVPHPLLFGLYPILFLYSQNTGLDLGWEFLRPAVLVTGFLTLVWLLLVVIKVNLQKAALVISIFFVLFFSFGHVADRLYEFQVKANFVFAAYVLLFAAAGWVIGRNRSDFRGVTVTANVMGAILLVFPVIGLLTQLAGLGTEAFGSQPETRDLQLAHNSGKLPHVYYIVLDAYGRADILDEIYDYRDTEFLDDLRDMGFYIADRSTTNYSQTILSLASALNLRYLSEREPALDENSTDRSKLMAEIRHNRVAASLASLGYEYVAFTSGYHGVQIRNADRDMRPIGGLTEFETVLLNMTPLEDIFLKMDWYNGWDVHRRRINYIFDQLPETAALETPSFVFVHILAPHPPFVFDADGGELDPRALSPGSGFIFNDGLYPGLSLTLEEYKRGYSRQAAYVSARLRTAIRILLSDSEVPPIIIVQGDHGPSSGMNSHLSNPNPDNLKERMSILNAYYLPGDGVSLLYPEISPVNSFRVVLNQYFGESFELLDDENHFSTWDRPFEFVDVTETVAVD